MRAVPFLELRAIESLRAQGWSDLDIRKLLGIGRTQFYERLKRLRDIGDRAERGRDDDGDE